LLYHLAELRVSWIESSSVDECCERIVFVNTVNQRDRRTTASTYPKWLNPND
jgi:hypothetical protein